MTIDNDGNLKICPHVTAEEHQQVQREEKAGTILLSALPDEHIDQHLIYEDLDQMNKEEFDEYDLKHQMAMISIKVHRFEKKHGRKIKFNGREKERECRAQGGQNRNNYQKYKSKEVGKDGSDSKAMVVVDGSIDWDKQTEEGNTEPRSLENFGMVARIEIAPDVNLEGEVVSADNAIPAGVSVSAGDVATAIVSPQSKTEFALMGNKDKMEDFDDFDGGEVTFRGSTGKILGKGTIKTKNLNFENVLYVKELQHFNLISISQICDQTHRVLFTENE
nr:putative ribonuclease H-like domain-containing protein [Tanacetum cinerariifolium]